MAYMAGDDFCLFVYGELVLGFQISGADWPIYTIDVRCWPARQLSDARIGTLSGANFSFHRRADLALTTAQILFFVTHDCRSSRSTCLLSEMSVRTLAEAPFVWTRRAGRNPAVQ